jgi:flagellar protein FlbD
VIRLCRLNGSEVYVNADLVATVEAHHDTVVTLVDGKTFVVRDSADQVVDSVTRYRASVLALAERLADEQPEPEQDEPHPRLVVLRSAPQTDADDVTSARSEGGR